MHIVHLRTLTSRLSSSGAQIPVLTYQPFSTYRDYRSVYSASSVHSESQSTKRFVMHDHFLRSTARDHAWLVNIGTAQDTYMGSCSNSNAVQTLTSLCSVERHDVIWTSTARLESFQPVKRRLPIQIMYPNHADGHFCLHSPVSAISVVLEDSWHVEPSARCIHLGYNGISY
jgi:hypothetical protein